MGTLLWTTSVFAQVPPAPDADRSVLTLVQAGGLTVRCSIKKVASVADDDFIRFEFDNDRKDRIVLNNTSGYAIAADVFDPATGKLRFTVSGIANGDSAGLVYGSHFAWLAAKDGQIGIPCGKTVSATQPSVSSAIALGIPPKEGWRVSATVKSWIRFPGHPEDQPLEQTVDFEWRRPDAAGIAHAQARVRWLLKHTDDLQNAPITATLLEIPEVASAVPVPDLLHALDTLRDPFSGRPGIVQFLVTRHRTAPEVIDYYAARVTANDRDAIDDLAYAGNAAPLWDDRFIAPLVADVVADQYGTGSLRTGLRVLDAHADRWKSNPAMCEQLSGAALKFPAKPGVPDFGLLAQTHDAKLIPTLVPYLNDKAIVRDFANDARVGLDDHPAPIRVCDAAYNTICIFRGTPNDQIDFADWREVSKTDPNRSVPRDPVAELRRRDGLVAVMAKMLAGPDSRSAK